MALQQGIVEGLEQPVDFFLAGQLHEVTSTIALTSHAAEVAAVWINDGVFNSMPEDLQEMLLEATRRHARIVSEEIAAREAGLIQYLVDEHDFILTRPALAPFQAGALAAVRQFEDEWGVGEYENLLAVLGR